jgi:cytochrome b561
MKFRNPVDRWGPVSQFLHWTIALLVVAMGVLGLWMVELPNTPRKIEIYALHKSIGLTLLALVAVRLAWRLYAGAPATLAGLPRWQVRAANVTHAALYGLLFAMPLSGWLLNAAAGFPLQWFGLFNLPRVIGRDDGLRELATTLHEAGFWLLLVLVLVHAGAAFHHHLFRQDDTLARMLPRRRVRPAAPENLHGT